MRRSIEPISVATCLMATALFAQPPAPADLVLRNGKIVTLDPAAPQAEALAARGQRIVALGSNAQMRGYIGPATSVIDLKGALAVPGFIEGHGHFTGLGRSKMILNLRDAQRWDDIVAMVRAAAKEAKPGAWILGRGFHQSKWTAPPPDAVAGFPVHQSLSEAAPDNPVLLTHASGHAAMVNAMALKLAGITRDTPNPNGGEILKDAHGEPTGLLNEKAQGLVRASMLDGEAKRTAADRAADARREIELAAQECLSKGVTSFQDAGSPFATIDLMRQMAGAGQIGVRLWVMLRMPNEQLAAGIARYPLLNAADYHLTVRAIKRQMDGALGSRGAWLIDPYYDLPGSRGMNTEEIADLDRAAELAIQHGLQLCVHAIGDRANRETLNLFERAFRKHPEKHDLRWRIEHAQHLDPEDIPRFGKLGVIASMQGVHCTSDAPFVLARLGRNRAEAGAYPWRKLIASGAIVTNGTDTPVEDVSPIASFYASVTRKLKDGSTFFPEQKMTRMEALRSYTALNAYAAFEENLKGTLKKGMLADVTVLSKDILTVPDDDIPSTEIEYTIVGGKVLYKR